MAQYRCSVKPNLSRCRGASVVRAASYIAREKLNDERTGEIFDYSGKKDKAIWLGIYAPKNALEWTSDLEKFCNEIERSEKRKDAQLARPLELSLAHELTLDQNRWMMQDFIKENFTRHGYATIAAIHEPPPNGDERNIHAHLLVGLRTIDENGFAKTKQQEQENYKAKTAYVENLRHSWEKHLKHHLERHGHKEAAALVSCASLAARGIKREPPVHLGPNATHMERKGKQTELGDKNRVIEKRNRQLTKLRAERQDITKAVNEIMKAEQENAARLEIGQQATRKQEREQHEEKQEATAMTQEPARHEETAREEEQKREEQRRDEELKQEETQKEEERKHQTELEEEQKKQDAIKQETEQKEEEHRRAQFKEQANSLAEQARIMEQQQLQFEAYKAELYRRAEEERRQAEQQKEAKETARARELEIKDAHSRYGQALGQHYDIRDPYGSLARSSMAEYGTFLRDRENINQQIAKEKDPAARKVLQLRQRIEAADYMAITSNRIATQSEIITGRRNSEEAVQQRARAAGFEKEAKELRAQYRELQTPKVLEQDKTIEPPAREAARPQEKPAEIKPEPARAPESKAPPLMVEERQPGKPRGTAQSLNSFLQEQPLPAQQQQQNFTPAQIRTDSAARRAHYSQLVAEQKRGNALDRMGEDMRAGRNLSADDVRKLSRDDLEKIKAGGDERLRELTQERQRTREPERER